MPLGDEYIQWPGEATFPGKDTYPAYDASAAGNKTVHSHKGWEWVESENPFQQAVASLANAAIATAVQRSRTTFGQVYYQRGNSTDPPGFPGTAIGDTCRIQDPGTLDIVAEWKWNGTAWEKALVSGQQISNLDVGRLTAGSAAINELAARRIAGDVGKFLQISTDQLVVSGQATINTAVVQEIWSKIIHAQEGEFERIKAGMISGNAFEGQTFTGGTFEGQVITGAQIQTAKTGGRVLMNPSGLFAYRGDGSESFRLEANTGNIRIYGYLGFRDSWSLGEFTEWSDDNEFINGTAVHFTSTTRNYAQDGLLMLREWKGGGNRPQIMLRAPSISAAGTPRLVLDATMVHLGGFQNGAYLNMSPQTFSVFTGGSAASPSVALDNEKFQVRTWNGDTIFRIERDGLYFNNEGDERGFFVKKTRFSLRPYDYSERSVWASPTQVVIGYDNQHYSWWGAGGMNTIGGKAFVMRVPRMSEERGLWLKHNSTESPHHGIEYWQNVTLNGNGEGEWVLPDYLPLIASPTAPRVVLCSPDRGTAAGRLDTSAETWKVRVTGQPGAHVAVLLKLARILDDRSDESGNVQWRDAEEDSVWVLPTPYNMEDSGEDRGLPGDVYGPPTREAAQAAAGVV